MFLRRFGEVDDDVFYTEQILRDDLAYAQAMLNQPISDYEKEQWQAEVSQFSGTLADMGIPDINYSQTFGSELGGELGVLTAGFDFASGWPILVTLAIGAFIALRKGDNKTQHRRRKLRRKRR